MRSVPRRQKTNPRRNVTRWNVPRRIVSEIIVLGRIVLGKNVPEKYPRRIVLGGT